MIGSGTDAGSPFSYRTCKRQAEDKTKRLLYPYAKVTNLEACDKCRKHSGENIVVLQSSVIGMESQNQALSSNFPHSMH